MRDIASTLLDDFQLNGIWWLPDNPDQRLSGTLFFKNEGEITLNLVDSFGDVDSRWASYGRGQGIRQEIILGITGTGKPCTLYDNFETKTVFSFPVVLAPSSFRSHYLFVGAHYKHPSEILFSSTLAGFTNLENWIGRFPFRLQSGTDSYSCSYERPSEFKAILPERHTIIRLESGYSTSADCTQFMLRHTAFLEIAPENPQGLSWYWKVLYELCNLLTLLTGETIHVRQFRAFGLNMKENEDRRSDDIIEVYFTKKKHHARDNISTDEMTMPLPTILDKISAILEAWFSKAETLRSPCDLFFGTFYNPTMSREFQFLALIQAIESFHRVVHGGKYLEDGEWAPHQAAMKERIPDGLESNHKESLKSRIKYGNEYSLRKRLQEIVDSFDGQVSEAISPSRNYYTGVIVDTRHYFTHYDDSLREGALQGSGLYEANQRLTILMTLLLLREIGIDPTDTLASLRENPWYARLIKETAQAAKTDRTTSPVDSATPQLEPLREIELQKDTPTR